MLEKTKLDMPIVLTRLREHENIKDELMFHINNQDANRIYSDSHKDLDITRCDWNIDREVPRQWLEILRPHLTIELDSIYKELGYSKYDVKNIWFQQYATNGVHGWHVHVDCQWTNVYYVDMPDDCPQTEIINPYNQKEIIKVDVKEGDILTFPSFVIHRAPVNKSNKTKTIISFNSDADIEGGYYNE